MRSQIENISGKMDALTESRHQTKDEGKLLVKMYFVEDIVRDTRSVLLLLLFVFSFKNNLNAS